MDMQNGVAIITGASSGIGATCARQLAEKGSHVVINYSRNEEGARHTQQACEAYGVETLVVKANVVDDDECRAMVNTALDKWGRLDALINNAGTTKCNPHQNLEGLSKQDFIDIYAVNTVGPYQMIRAVVEAMKMGGRGSVVNVASVAGITGVGGSIAYAASKGALITMTLSLARVLGPEIRVNCICPGFVQGGCLERGLNSDNYRVTKERTESVAPLKLSATPDTIAEGILYFVCGADIVTGETLIMDGGAHLAHAELV